MRIKFGWLRPSRFDPGLEQLRAAMVIMAGVLASFFTAWLIEDRANLGTDVVVLAVVLAMTLGRTHPNEAQRGAGARTLLLLTVVAAGAALVGTLMYKHEVIGDALFVLALTVAIWLRRFGPLYARAGTLITLPFIALLVAPAAPSFSTSHTLWSAMIGLVAAAWVLALQQLARRIGVLPPTRPAVETSPAAPSPAAPTSARSRLARMPPSTRMAIQMGLGLGLAFLLGHDLFGHHWPWMVLTAYIVASGNRGRGDVVYKGGLRIAGAAVGTVAATLLANTFATGDRWAVVAIFVVLAAATWLRNFSYAYWAGSVTAALAFLYGYFGESGSALLRTRLEAILAGAVIAIAVAWVIFPIKTTNVLRRRVADVLAVLSDYLSAAGQGDPDELVRHEARLTKALEQLDQIAPAITAHRLVTRPFRTRANHADAIAAMQDWPQSIQRFTERATTEPGFLSDPDITREIGALRKDVTATRRIVGRRPGATLDPDHRDDATAAPRLRPITELRRGLTVIAAVVR